MKSKILIVSADLLWRRQLQGLYEHNGHLVESAANAIDAIKIGLVFGPHLVLSAWRLDEDTQGLHVAQALTKQVRKPHFVFMTNQSSKKLLPRCEHLESYEFLEVEASPNKLLDLVDLVQKQNERACSKTVSTAAKLGPR